MGMLVRLITSTAGAFGLGAAGAFGGGCIGVVFLFLLGKTGFLQRIKYIGALPNPYQPGSFLEEGPLFFLVLFACLGVPAVIAACFGMAYGYRGGLALGREICATNGPEHHSRIDVNLNHTRVS